MIADRTGAEESLRRAFADAVATVREDELRHDVPARPQGRLAGTGRRRLLIPAAAAAAVLAVSIVAVTVPNGVHAGSPGPGPTSAVVAGPTAYVVTGDGNDTSAKQIVRISLATGRVVERFGLPAGGNAASSPDAAITPNGAIICILTDNYHGSYLTVIDSRTGAAAPPIALPAYSDSVAITPDGRSAYVFVQRPVDGVGVGIVVPVNLVNGSVGRKIRIAGGQQMVMTPNGRTVYVLTQQAAAKKGIQYYGPTSVVPIDTATNTAQHPIDVKAGGTATNIAVSPDGKTVYVATFWWNHHMSAITPISTASNAAMAPIPIRTAYFGGTGTYLTMAPDGNTAYLYGSSPQYVVRIDLRTNKMLKPIRLPADYACIMRKKVCTATWAWNLLIAPDSRTGYLYGPPNDDVIPIDLATGTVQAPVVVARPPYTQTSSPLIAFGSGYLYVPVAYFTARSHGAVRDFGVSGANGLRVQSHGGLSLVDLATGQVRTTALGEWPQQVIVAP
jgi:hypothetical protein